MLVVMAANRSADSKNPNVIGTSILFIPPGNSYI